MDSRAAAGGKPLAQLPVEEARLMSAGLRDLAGSQEPVAEVQNRTVPGPAGPIAVRVYRPMAKETLPVLIYFHGGGFVICSLDTHDGECRRLANASGCAVISVDYRLAPENKNSSGLGGAYGATQYVAQQAAAFVIY